MVHHARHMVVAGHHLIHWGAPGLAVLRRRGTDGEREGSDGEGGGNCASADEGGHENLAKHVTVRDNIQGKPRPVGFGSSGGQLLRHQSIPVPREPQGCGRGNDPLPITRRAVMLIARRFWREAPLVEIKNEKDFEAWLQGKPRAVSIALAARASLRVLPLLQTKEPDERYVRDIVLPSLRAMAVSQAVAKYPAHETELATRVATAAFVAVGPNDVTALTANAAAQAARAAALPNAFTAAARAAAYAAAAADASADASASDTATFWSAVSDDATRVEEGVAAADIPGSPLWQRQRFHYKFFGPDDIRDHFNRSPVAELVNEQPDRLNSSWQKLKAALLRAKQDWDVWTDWYDDRLDGRVRNEERELAYVRIDDALWNQGPAIVNAEIKRRIEELPAIESVPVDNPQFGELQSSSAANAILAAWQPDEHGVVQLEALGQSGLQGRAGPLNTAALNTLALNQANTAIDSAPSVAEPVPPIEAIPEQEPIATRFGVNTAGVIDVVPDPLAPETVADALQREYYDELRFKAQALIELGPNQLGDLGGSAERFREALGAHRRDFDCQPVVTWQHLA